eukprot:TRINITY_DN15585_c0_g2_i1.p1 TRINITY_DN15585_c0_g2~~TRINITY_DN15585_c0_g2_i1.p1  ORF type:complete len:266 (+),score=66.45 TRINITY_DN15585_c0_g2_i1:102-899(+)
MGDVLSKCPGGCCETAVAVPTPVEHGTPLAHGAERGPVTTEDAAKYIEHSPTPPRQRHSSAPPARELRAKQQEHTASSATPPRCTDEDCDKSPTQEPGKAARGGQYQEISVVLSPPEQLWPPQEQRRAITSPGFGGGAGPSDELLAARAQKVRLPIDQARRRRPIPCAAPADRPKDVPKEDAHADSVPDPVRAPKITFSDHTDDRAYNKQVRGPAQQGCSAPTVLKKTSGEQRDDGKGLGLRRDAHAPRSALSEMDPNDRAGYAH